uniref:DDE Tnp4 domain-containing protein n=1 Tax=Brassica oleracea var. oleracea TaxID=109376 RepID=A0A0D3CE70_BRAOL
MNPLNPYSQSSGYMGLLHGQHESVLPENSPYESFHSGSSEIPQFSSQQCEAQTPPTDISVERGKRHKWTPSDDEIINGNALEFNFHVNGREYHLAYYLADGIYPKWATFIQYIRLPQGPKHCLFAKNQEAVRKDVERAFGVLQARFAVVRNPSNLWDKNKIGNIMRACIILHNMIVEYERDSYTNASEFQQGEDVDPTFVVKRTTNLDLTLGDQESWRVITKDIIGHCQTEAMGNASGEFCIAHVLCDDHCIIVRFYISIKGTREAFFEGY